MSPPTSLRERLARMSHAELREALRRTGEGDRTHAAQRISAMYSDRGEAGRALIENLPVYERALSALVGEPQDAPSFLDDFLDAIRSLTRPADALQPAAAFACGKGSLDLDAHRESSGRYTLLATSPSPANWLIIIQPLDGEPWLLPDFVDAGGHAHTAVLRKDEFDVGSSPGTAVAFVAETDFLDGGVEPEALLQTLQDRAPGLILLQTEYGADAP